MYVWHVFFMHVHTYKIMLQMMFVILVDLFIFSQHLKNRRQKCIQRSVQMVGVELNEFSLSCNQLLSRSRNRLLPVTQNVSHASQSLSPPNMTVLTCITVGEFCLLLNFTQIESYSTWSIVYDFFGSTLIYKVPSCYCV